MIPKALRGGMERISRDVILRRRLPAEFGQEPLLVSPGCGLRYWHWSLGATDPWLLGMALELVRPGDTVWDIGANLGLFAVAAASRAGATGRVIAVEPDTWTVELLRRSIRGLSPRAAKVDLLPAAVSSNLGVASFLVAHRARAASHLEGTGTDQAGGARERQPVLTVSLDWLLDHFPAPSVLKIDVEGAELDVLRGAQKLLECYRPRILCEVSVDNAARAGELLRGHGYTLFDAKAAAADRQPITAAVWDTLALPA